MRQRDFGFALADSVQIYKGLNYTTKFTRGSQSSQRIHKKNKDLSKISYFEHFVCPFLRVLCVFIFYESALNLTVNPLHFINKATIKKLQILKSGVLADG